MDRTDAHGGLHEPADTVGEAPGGAPPGAQVDDALHMVPGADFEERDRGGEKPWSTSLAYESEDAGVANEPDSHDE
ncbi:MAG TPA: hypothetical protein VHK06_06000 [Candidatus Limnocylindria bacterium]|nr:hypothetical protein [Candidatus Limnocylindria bacterium]